MYRQIVLQLQEWKNQEKRKPLIINGARQVGKSWIVKKFGEENYEGQVHIINFEKQRDIHAIFDADFNIKRIILELELILNITISQSKDLIFFDEIQSCEKALASLRYFYEDMPELHLITAGSLLDFEFRNIPYPVGRVQTLNMYPMTFYEFLIAQGKDRLAEILKDHKAHLSEVIQKKIYSELQLYFVVGGMPECVSEFVAHQKFEKIHQLQDELNYSFSKDFKKYNPTVNSGCLHDIITNSTRLIGSQIIYTKLSNAFSGPTIKKGVQVLTTARILNKANNVSVSGLPLSVSEKRFKLYHLDIGLLLRNSKLRYEEHFIAKNLVASFKGALAEQFVAQEITAHQNDPLYYWSNTNPGTSGEVDFVIVREGNIIPIEVKSGKSGSLKSLHYLMDQNKHISKAIVLSQAQQGAIDKIDFIPLFFAGHI